jgi:cell division cycle 2-like protein
VFLVMDFLEHDLKTLQEQMIEPFLPSEVKTLMLQITSGVQYLHDNWILHVRRLRWASFANTGQRDLKTSNVRQPYHRRPANSARS